MKTFLKAIELMQTLDERMQAQTITVFLLVCEFGPCRMASIRKMANISQASVSRNCATLGLIHRRGEPGFGLVSTEEDPMDRKHKFVQLTMKGERYRTMLHDILNQEGDIA